MCYTDLQTLLSEKMDTRLKSGDWCKRVAATLQMAAEKQPDLLAQIESKRLDKTFK